MSTGDIICLTKEGRERATGSESVAKKFPCRHIDFQNFQNKINISILLSRRDDQLPLIWPRLFPLRSHDSVRLLNVSPSLLNQPQTSCSSLKKHPSNTIEQHCALGAPECAGWGGDGGRGRGVSPHTMRYDGALVMETVCETNPVLTEKRHTGLFTSNYHLDSQVRVLYSRSVSLFIARIRPNAPSVTQ